MVCWPTRGITDVLISINCSGNGGEGGEGGGSGRSFRRQFCIVLSEAIVMHKSQGQVVHSPPRLRVPQPCQASRRPRLLSLWRLTSPRGFVVKPVIVQAKAGEGSALGGGGWPFTCTASRVERCRSVLVIGYMGQVLLCFATRAPS